MLRLILVACVAILVSEISQIFAEPTEAPETTDQDNRRFFYLDGPIKRGCWTEWFDRDDPSGSGDWETLKDLRKENPGKICPQPRDIQAQTLSGQKAPAPGDEAIQISPFVGLICKNKAQKDKECEDYRVRFRCFPPFCADLPDIRKIPLHGKPMEPLCWTAWFDRDDPSGTGDWERLSDLRNENPGQICAYPLAMEVLTTDTSIAALNAGQNLYLHEQNYGFVCRNIDQESEDCYDYKVRFSCPCLY